MEGQVHCEVGKPEGEGIMLAHLSTNTIQVIPSEMKAFEVFE